MIVKPQRDEATMMALILGFAQNDEKIRALILNGSRASKSVKKDHFQDYDILCLVTEVEPFVKDRTWMEPFGGLIIMQTPDEMDGNWAKDKDAYGYLMLFEDGNRIDFTFMTIDKYQASHRDSRSVLLLDKDKIFSSFPESSDTDYLPKKPTQIEFYHCCNEFYWVAPYVVKGLARKQLIYAKTCEQIIRHELIKLMTWQAALNTGFSKPLGQYGKDLEQYLDKSTWAKFLKTYKDANYGNMWDALFEMIELFHELALNLSQTMRFSYHENEFQNVLVYLKWTKEQK